MTNNSTVFLLNIRIIVHLLHVLIKQEIFGNKAMIALHVQQCFELNSNTLIRYVYHVLPPSLI